MFLGNQFVDAVNFASMSGGGDWPVPGGLLAQSAWFLSLKRQLTHETNRIESEQMEQ